MMMMMMMIAEIYKEIVVIIIITMIIKRKINTAMFNENLCIRYRLNVVCHQYNKICNFL